MEDDKSNPGTSKTEQFDFSKISPEDKLRILCLHGYRQNADSFKSKLGSFRKFVNKYAEFIFITAPHQAPPLDGGTPPEEGGDVSDQQKSWWFNKDDGTFKGTNIGGPAIGFEESLKLVEKVWEGEGPFHGLLGFSQGACFVGLICGLSLKGLTSINPSFAIMASGFPSGSLVHKNFYEEMISIPTLHIFGENDDIIPGEMSEILASNFRNPKILTHSGGHYFPATAQQKLIYIRFFQDRLKEHLEIKNELNVEKNNDDDGAETTSTTTTIISENSS